VLTTASVVHAATRRRWSFEISEPTKRARLEAALAKPLTDDTGVGHFDLFSPWWDVIQGINGSYASECDELMIAALEAVRDGETFEFIDDHGFLGEFALYVLAGHGLTDYGTSPRGGWPDGEIKDLWDPLIAKWKAYAEIQWSETEDA